MSFIREIILECDFFAHGTFHRYKQQQSYRTLVGGVISIVLVILFVAVFFNLALSTFKKTIVTSQTSISYDIDPTLSELRTSSSSGFMFAIGISGLNLSDSQRYFDISMWSKSFTKNGTGFSKDEKLVSLKPCTIDQWRGANEAIANSFWNIGLSQYLCPPSDYVFPLQGKYTSDVFKYVAITVGECSGNSLLAKTTCRNSSEISSYLKANGEFTLNFYFINSVINADENTYLKYYLEDRNYFVFDTVTGVSANLFLGDYKVTTDHSLFPWAENQEVQGLYTPNTASWRNFKVQESSKQYLKIYLRKDTERKSVSRSFQKLDQTFSYIGGLFGTIILLLIFLKLYSKYSYELEFGDKIFKETDNGGFGSENFNFVVFLGYMVFNMLATVGLMLNWKTMKKYHRCRMECLKQLSIDLLFRKIEHFEEVASIVLEDYQLKMLLVARKPTIEQAKKNRKRYLVKDAIYHQLQRKGHEVFVQREEFVSRLQGYLEESKNLNLKKSLEPNHLQQNIHYQITNSFKKIQEEQKINHPYSRKIARRLSLDRVLASAFKNIRNLEPEDERDSVRPKRVESEMMQEEERPVSSHALIKREMAVRPCFDLNEILQFKEVSLGNI